MLMVPAVGQEQPPQVRDQRRPGVRREQRRPARVVLIQRDLPLDSLDAVKTRQVRGLDLGHVQQVAGPAGPGHHQIVQVRGQSDGSPARVLQDGLTVRGPQVGARRLGVIAAGRVKRFGVGVDAGIRVGLETKEIAEPDITTSRDQRHGLGS
jgi:hypothetical protein